MDNISAEQWFNIDGFVIDNQNNNYKILKPVRLDEKNQIYIVSNSKTGDKYLLQCFKTTYQNYSQMKRRIKSLETLPPVVYEPEKIYVEIPEKSIHSFFYKLKEESKVHFDDELDINSYKKFIFNCLSYLEKFSLNYYLTKEDIIKINNSYYFLLSNIDLDDVSDNLYLNLLTTLMNNLKKALKIDSLLEGKNVSQHKLLKYIYQLDSELHTCEKCHSIIHIKDEKSLKCINNCDTFLEVYELSSEKKRVILKNEFSIYEDFFQDNGNYNKVIARVSQFGDNSNMIGLTNLSGEDWLVGLKNLNISIKPHRTLRALENLNIKIFDEVYTFRVLKYI